MSRATLYRWKARFSPQQLSSLRPRSRRPKRLRGPQWSQALERAVLDWRQDFPRWGKDELAVMLQRQGQPCSASSVGRILGYLERHGRLVESPLRPAKLHKQCQQRGIRLFILLPRSPRLNGCAERAHRTPLEEYYSGIRMPLASGGTEPGTGGLVINLQLRATSPGVGIQDALASVAAIRYRAGRFSRPVSYVLNEHNGLTDSSAECCNKPRR